MQNITPCLSLETLWRLPDDSWVSPEHAAALIDCSISSLAHWRSDDKGPVYRKRGKLVRYQIADIKSWLTEDTTEQNN